MARKRMISPEFWTDQKIGKLKRDTRLFFIGLWNESDDEGKQPASPALLKSRVFPYDEDINSDIIHDMLIELSLSGQVVLYESNGEKLLFIKNFLKWQTINRPTESRFLSPKQVPITEDSMSNHGTLTDGSRTIEVKLSEEKLKELKELKKPFLFEIEHLELANLLKSRILQNCPEARITDAQVNQWANEVRLMVTRDNRTLGRIKEVLEWSQTDTFWKSNIHSMGKLRKQFGQLVAKMTAQPPKKIPNSGCPDISDAFEEARRLGLE